METVKAYLRNADECEALARQAVSPQHRTAILRMAETWRLLATQRMDMLRERDPGL